MCCDFANWRCSDYNCFLWSMWFYLRISLELSSHIGSSRFCFLGIITGGSPSCRWSSATFLRSFCLSASITLRFSKGGPFTFGKIFFNRKVEQAVNVRQLRHWKRTLEFPQLCQRRGMLTKESGGINAAGYQTTLAACMSHNIRPSP